MAGHRPLPPSPLRKTEKQTERTKIEIPDPIQRQEFRLRTLEKLETETEKTTGEIAKEAAIETFTKIEIKKKPEPSEFIKDIIKAKLLIFYL